MKRLCWLFLIPLCTGLAGCSLEKEIDLNLPEFKSELIVECYLEAGKPYRVSVSESSSYFDRPEPVLVPDATVIITHNGTADTLRFRPYLDNQSGKFYTHSSEVIATGEPGDSYALEVFDTRGRHVTGTTSFLPTVNFDTLEYKFNDQNKALLLATFQDNASTEDFYRFQIFKDTLNIEKRQRDIFATDRLQNGLKIQYSTTYRFERNDTLCVLLYHLEKPYYDFLNTVNDAQNANGNPFAQPNVIKPTVNGGFGVFTTLAYDKKWIILK